MSCPRLAWPDDDSHNGELYETHRAGGSTLVDCTSDFMKRDRANTRGSTIRTVLVVAAGGLEHGGGIGRQMGYFLRAHQQTEQRLRYQVVDPRGPWYLANHRGMSSVPLFILAAPSLRWLARVLRRPAWHISTLQGAGAPFGR